MFIFVSCGFLLKFCSIMIICNSISKHVTNGDIMQNLTRFDTQYNIHSPKYNINICINMYIYIYIYVYMKQDTYHITVLKCSRSNNVLETENS